MSLKVKSDICYFEQKLKGFGCGVKTPSINSRKCLRPLERPDYCQTRKKKNSGKNNAVKMCLETTNENPDDEKSSFSFTHSNMTLTGDGYSNESEKATSFSAYMSPYDCRLNNMDQEMTDSCISEEAGVKCSPSLKTESIKEKVCVLCEEKFVDLRKLTLHLKKHQAESNDAHTCVVCQKTLSSGSSLDRHLLVHSGERPYECDICHGTFTTNGNMNRHMRTREKKRGSCSSVESAPKRVKIDNGASKCSNLPVTEENITEEVKNKFHSCANCMNRFKDLMKLEFSSKNFPLIARLDCENREVCPMDKEIPTKTDANTCQNCHLAFPCIRSLQAHRNAEKHGHSLICKTCGSCFLTEEALQHHEYEHIHLNPGSLKFGNDNEENKENFFQKIGLFDKKMVPFCAKEQLKHSEPVIIQENKLIQPTSQDSKKYLAHNDSSNDFADIHSILSLTTKSSIPEIGTLPTTVAPIASQSDNQTSFRPHLDLKTIKESDSPPNSLPVINIPNESIKEESIEDILSPDEGSRSFTDLEITSGTMQSNHVPKKSKSKTSKKKRLQCEICKYTSVDKSTLARHMRTHNGERPFKCSICDYAFTTKANTTRHLRKKHHLPKLQSNKFAVYNQTKYKTQSSNIVCQFCKSHFDNTRVLQHHLRSVTSCKGKPFLCGLCNGGFTTKNNCIRHINVKHPEASKENFDGIIKCNERYFGKKQIKSEVSHQVENLPIDVKGDQQNISSSADVESGNFYITENDTVFSSPSDTDCQNVENKVSPEHSWDDTTSQDIKVHSIAVHQNSTDENSVHYSRTILNDNINTAHVSAAHTLIQLMSVPEVHDVLAHNEQPHDVEHNEQPHDVPAHNEQPHYISVHNEQPHDVPAHNEQPHDVPVHNEQPHDVPVHNEQPHDVPAHNEQPHDVPAHNERPLDLSLQPLDLSIKKFKSVPDHSVAEDNLQFTFSPHDAQEKQINRLAPENDSEDHPINLSCNRSMLDNSACISPFWGIPNIMPCQNRLPCYDFQALKPAEKQTNRIPVECEICFKSFSTKSNKERHIKKKHPAYYQSPKHGINSVSATSESPKHNQNVSDTTKNLIRSLIMPKINNSQNSTDEDSRGSEYGLCIVENDTSTDISNAENLLQSTPKHDSESNDLASVSSVIDTANSQEISKFLKDANLTNDSSKIGNTAESNVQSNMKKNSTGKIIKPFPCPICPKSFSSSAAVENHMIKHTNNKDLVCSECNKPFSSKSNRDRHLKKKCCLKTNYRLKNLNNTFDDKLDHQEDSSLKNNSNDSYVHLSFNDLHIFRSSPILQHYAQKMFSNSFDARLADGNTHATINVPIQNFNQRFDLECQFCKNTYKSNEDLSNHVKELHVSEYISLLGEDINPKDSIEAFKKNGLMKKRFL